MVFGMHCHCRCTQAWVFAGSLPVSTAQQTLFAVQKKTRPHTVAVERSRVACVDIACTSDSICRLIGKAGAAVAIAACILSSEPALARNVRAEDVDSPAMQSGLRAANEGRFEDAERMFQVVLSQDANSASAWSNLGNTHLSEGKAAQAVEDFNRAISLAPSAPVPYLNRAIAEEQLGVEAASSGRDEEAQVHYDRAIQDCTEATTRDAKEFAAYFNRGNVLMRLSRYGDALDAYRQAADLAPGIAGYRLREAELMFQQGETSNADRMMRGVVRKNPRYAEAQAALAAVNWAAGKGEVAEEHFDAATRIDENWGDMQYIRSQTKWPPNLYAAMEKFLTISRGAS